MQKYNFIYEKSKLLIIYLAKKTVKNTSRWRFFTVFLQFLLLNKLLWLLLTVTEIYGSVGGNFGHVVLLSFGMFIFFRIIELTFTVALFVAPTG